MQFVSICPQFVSISAQFVSITNPVFPLLY